MSKLRSRYSITSYGIYDKWDSRSKTLPSVTHFTTDIPAALDIEFGFILHAEKAKGKRLDFTIFHPDIKDEDGQILAPFTGDIVVRTNHWDFYLGDTIWSPLDDKLGEWRMVIESDDNTVAEKVFNVISDDDYGIGQFWKKRGF